MGRARDLDLWTPVVPEPKQHHNFRTILRVGQAAAQQVVSDWAESFSDRDGKFVKEFQTTFDSAFWELYLHAVFRALGFTSDYTHSAPDFVLSTPVGPIVAEAAIAKHASGFRPEWDKHDTMKAYAAFNLHQAVRYTTTRLSNAFTGKADKYIASYRHLAHVPKGPYLICLAPFDHPFSFDWALQAMRRVLYGVDQPIVHEVPSTSKRIVLGMSEVHSITKDSGEDFPIAYFRDPQYSHVSAVLFSSTATWSKVRALSNDPMPHSTFRSERLNTLGELPLLSIAKKPHYEEVLTDGLAIMLNPHAACPLDTAPFKDGHISTETLDLDSEEHVWDAPHGWLLRRFVMSAVPVEKFSEQPQTPTEYRSLTPPPWPPNELRRVPVIMWPAAENWMGHTPDGWTVVVFQDSIDGTWHSFAVHAVAHTIPEVRALNEAEKTPSLWCLDDHPTRDSAWADIRLTIKHHMLSGSQ